MDAAHPALALAALDRAQEPEQAPAVVQEPELFPESVFRAEKETRAPVTRRS